MKDFAIKILISGMVLLRKGGEETMVVKIFSAGGCREDV